MISASGISKSYGSIRAVNGISFSINEGEITGLLGPNGAGKTTTLRMLTGYLKPDSGEVVVGDLRAGEADVRLRQMIGYLPESAPVYGDMLVYDYLSYIASVRDIPDSHASIERAAVLCGILPVMHRNVNELSKGYRQRVGLAQAIIHDPQILILDEPTTGLDPNQIVEIRSLIREIGKKKTVILSTHILSEVEAACDRVIIINRGNIAADERTESLLSSASGGLTVRAAGVSADELVAALSSLQGAGSAVQCEGEPGLASAVVRSVQNGTDLRPGVFNLARDRGWTLYELSREQNTLENIFRELTSGGNNE